MDELSRIEPSRALAYSVPECARQLGVSTPIIYREIREGRLTAFKFGRRTLIAANDLELFVHRLKQVPFAATDTRAAADARYGRTGQHPG